jgi:hypothetical protein
VRIEQSSTDEIHECPRTRRLRTILRNKRFRTISGSGASAIAATTTSQDGTTAGTWVHSRLGDLSGPAARADGKIQAQSLAESRDPGVVPEGKDGSGTLAECGELLLARWLVNVNESRPSTAPCGRCRGQLFILGQPIEERVGMAQAVGNETAPPIVTG